MIKRMGEIFLILIYFLGFLIGDMHQLCYEKANISTMPLRNSAFSLSLLINPRTNKPLCRNRLNPPSPCCSTEILLCRNPTDFQTWMLLTLDRRNTVVVLVDRTHAVDKQSKKEKEKGDERGDIDR